VNQGKEDRPPLPQPDPRQLDVLLFLNLVGPADEGDVAYGLRLEPQDFARIPDGFRDMAGEYVARRELEALARMGLVTGDGVVWELTARGREVLAELESQAP